MSMQNHEWQQTREGHNGIRHTLIGTSYSVLAVGESTIIGYGQHGRARRVGRRHFYIYDGDRRFRACDTLQMAKQTAERRAEG